MLHRAIQTFQRAALRQSSARLHGRVYAFRSQPGPLYTITRSLYDDSDVRPSSQDSSQAPSQAPSYQSSPVDKINALQSDMSTTKLQLDRLKESTNIEMNNLQTSLTGQLSALDFKISALESKCDSKINAPGFKIGALESNLDSKFDRLGAIFERGILILKTELIERETRLVWGFVFAASVLIFPTFSLLII
ncbi:hypothetical protein V2W45_161251 [Cenococcum geophilum]